MPESLSVAAIIILAVFTQSFLGFGSAIVSMTLLPGVIGLPLATPLFSVIGILFEPVLLMYYRHGLDFRAVRTLIVSSIVGIPVGIFMLNRLPERVMLPVQEKIIKRKTFSDEIFSCEDLAGEALSPGDLWASSTREHMYNQ